MISSVYIGHRSICLLVKENIDILYSYYSLQNIHLLHNRIFDDSLWPLYDDDDNCDCSYLLFMWIVRLSSTYSICQYQFRRIDCFQRQSCPGGLHTIIWRHRYNYTPAT